MRKLTYKQQIMGDVDSHIAFYRAQIDAVPVDKRHEGNSDYTIPRSRWTNTKHDLAYLKRGTNWYIVRDGIYPYSIYRYAIQIPSPSM